eukprot:14455652-Alexandrium_andersonii.AAC.1
MRPHLQRNARMPLTNNIAFTCSAVLYVRCNQPSTKTFNRSAGKLRGACAQCIDLNQTSLNLKKRSWKPPKSSHGSQMKA